MHTDIGLIIAIVGTGIAMIGVVMAMMFWARSESNSLRTDAKEDRKDFINLYRHSERELSEHRKEMNQISRNIENTVQAIDREIRDFHRQLLEIQKKVG